MSDKDDLEEETQDLEKELKEMESSLKRVMADFDNYRKRMTKEKKSIVERAGAQLMYDLLEVLDDLERALESELSEDGMKMVYRKLKNKLQDHGLESIEALDKEFDPMYHECVFSEEVEDEAQVDKVLEEVNKGYKMNSRVIRPAKVKVGKKKEEVKKDE
ncbi:MAG: nucleotide exchange factor GrpE [Thermoplasmata archaeon]